MRISSVGMKSIQLSIPICSYERVSGARRLLVFGLVEHQHIGMNVDIGPPSLAGFPLPKCWDSPDSTFPPVSDNFV